jgi:spermidine synthase
MRADLPSATVSEHDGVRYLHLGTPWVQGAMRPAAPAAIELAYVQRMLSCLLWLPARALGRGHAVQLGLGAGTITRFTLQQLRMATTVVEVNREVVQACQAWFRLPRSHERLRVEIADAGDWMARAPQSVLAGQVQLLHVDLYDEQAAAPVLDDQPFYGACRALLAAGGVMAVNLFGRDASFARSIARIGAAFGPGQVWTLQPTREGNTVVVAGREVVVPGREELAARAAAIEARFGRLGLPARKWVRMVRPFPGFEAGAGERRSADNRHP